MKIKLTIPLLLVFVPFFIFGQEQKQILFTVDGEPEYVDSFKEMYHKNQQLLEENSRINVEEYLQLYIAYSLKVKEAKELGLDEKASFKNEFHSYRTKLAQKHITQSEVTEELVREAYERLQKVVNASHILIRLQPNPLPEDTLEAYQRTIKIRNEIRAGKPFAEAAKEFSADPSAMENDGNLGWFTVFKMVYPFETAAYETKVGEISMPVRTQFGYHLIKVNNKRPARGEVKVAHIMLLDGKDSLSKPKERIDELYAQLQNGASFEALAKQHSDDKNTAAKGGELNWFDIGDLNVPKFGEVAFSMETPNSISEPFHSKFGWHIIKFIDDRPIGSFEENKAELENKIKNDSRAHLISDSVFRQLREHYKIKTNQEALNFFHGIVNDSILTGNWTLDSSAIPQKNIVQIEKNAKTYRDFGKYLFRMQKTPGNFHNKNQLIDEYYDDFVNMFLLDHQRKNLEEINPEFAAISTEYYNGLLVFDLMEQEVWNPAKKDSVGLQKYFKNHQKKYAPKNLDNAYGLIQSDYQKNLEAQWIKSLRKKYKVEINQSNLRNLKTALEKVE